MPRTGTTSLFHILGKHPDLFQPFRKEVGYYLYNFDRGPRWHAGVYRHCRPGQVALDATPEYFFSDAALERLARLGAPSRVVLGVRAPAELAVSLFEEYRRRRYDVPPFDDFLGGYRYHRRSTAIEASFADRAVSRRLQEFRRRLGDRLLLYDYRLLCADPLRVVRCIETFLGVRSYFAPATFANLFFNTRDRTDSRVLSYLLGNERLIETLERLAPRKLLVTLAALQYRLMGLSRGRRSPEGSPGAPQWLHEEGTEMLRIFDRGGVLLGTGDPAPMNCAT